MEIIYNRPSIVKNYLKSAKAEELQLKQRLKSFWRSKPEKLAKLLKKMVETAESIVNIKLYQQLVEKFMEPKEFKARAEIKADLDYKAKDGDKFNQQNTANCGVDMEYTGLNSDFDLPEEKLGYEEPIDIAYIDEKLKENKSQP